MKKPKLFIAALIAALTLSGCDLLGLPTMKDVLDMITGNTDQPDTDNTDSDNNDEPPAPIYYTVKFNTERGTVSGSATQSIESGKTVTFPSATATGYTLLGWAKHSGTTVEEYNVGATYTVTSNITFYAIWKSNTVSVTGVTLNKTSLTLNVNEQETLIATVSPNTATNQNVTWTSSKTSVATISSSGVVKGIAAGTATITVTTEDGGKTATCAVTVKTATVPVTGVAVSPSSKTLNVGEQATLSATVSPSNATNKNVTWSTSNSNVATVSDSGKVVAKATGNTIITATSAYDSNIKATCNVTVSESEKDAWTIMVYVCGSSLESEYSAATNDILEMLDVNGIGGDVNVVLETGGCSRWKMSRSYLDGQTSISNKNLQRWEIINNKMKWVETVSGSNYLATKSSLQSFLDWGVKNYKAERYGVIMWNHGGGLAGCCYDDNYLDEEDYEIALSTEDVALVSRDALASNNLSKFDFIAYDCCLMQCADIASINADYYKYMFASQETEWDGGYDYDTWLDALVDNPGMSTLDLGDKIVKSFVDEQNSQRNYDQQSSVLDLSKMDTLTTDFNSFVDALSITSKNYSNITTAFKTSTGFGLDKGSSFYGLCDFEQLVTKIGASFEKGSKASTVVSDIKNVVVKNYYGSYFNSAKPCGLNGFVPYTYGGDNYMQVPKSYYTGQYATKFTPWQTAMLEFGSFDF